MTHRKSNGIVSWPEGERPRERLLTKGADKLTEAELLAIILRVGQGSFTARGQADRGRARRQAGEGRSQQRAHGARRTCTLRRNRQRKERDLKRFEHNHADGRHIRDAR